MCARFRQQNRLMLVYHGSSPSKNLGGGWAISFQAINNIEKCIYCLGNHRHKKWSKMQTTCKTKPCACHVSDWFHVHVYSKADATCPTYNYCYALDIWIAIESTVPSWNTPHVTRAYQGSKFQTLGRMARGNWTSAIQSSSQLKAVLRLCSGCSICNLWDLEKPTIETSKK